MEESEKEEVPNATSAARWVISLVLAPRAQAQVAITAVEVGAEVGAEVEAEVEETTAALAEVRGRPGESLVLPRVP